MICFRSGQESTQALRMARVTAIASAIPHRCAQMRGGLAKPFRLMLLVCWRRALGTTFGKRLTLLFSRGRGRPRAGFRQLYSVDDLKDADPRIRLLSGRMADCARVTNTISTMF